MENQKPLYKPRPELWPRFSLSFVFMLVLVVGGWLGWQMHVVRLRQTMRAQIEATGGFASDLENAFEGSWPSVRTVREANSASRASAIRRLMGDRDVLSVQFPREPTSKDVQAAAAFPEAHVYCLRSLNPGSDDRKPIAAGDWSQPVNGLCGRLLLAEDPKFNGTRMAVVYLELQNVSDRGNPMQIYYDEDRGLQCDLLDGSGKPPVGLTSGAADITTLGSDWITLPHDSALRFRVSVTGYSVPKNGGLSIGLMSRNWQIPRSSRTDYFLSGSFTVTPREGDDLSHRNAWQGVLRLPKLKIPAESP